VANMTTIADTSTRTVLEDTHVGGSQSLILGDLQVM